MTKQRLVIVGYGGQAREAAFCVEEMNRHSPEWEILGFVCKNGDEVGQTAGKYRVVCTDDDLLDMHVSVAIGIGDPALVRRIAERLHHRPNLSFPNLIHPTTIWDEQRVRLGQGNIICAATVFTTDIDIGSFNYFGVNCTYGHDVQIGNYCVFNPGINLSGSVVIGDGCLIGAGATLLQNIHIGDNATVGAGAVVIRDVAPGETVVGVPARTLVRKTAPDP